MRQTEAAGMTRHGRAESGGRIANQRAELTPADAAVDRAAPRRQLSRRRRRRRSH